MLVLSSLYLSL
uniref:Uncharacterized protein n=1 Tax=Anguilla anguilla TaxID=7936 RepID=A0A0E9TNL8_ANGAN